MDCGSESENEQIIRLLTEIRDELRRGKRAKKAQSELPLTEMPRIAEIWNSFADSKLPRVVSVSRASPRFKSCAERWKEHPSEDYWKNVIMRINRSAFCLGAGPRGWLADIGFLIRPDNAAKVLEGKYDNKGPVKKKPPLVVSELNEETGEFIVREIPQE